MGILIYSSLFLSPSTSFSPPSAPHHMHRHTIIMLTSYLCSNNNHLYTMVTISYGRSPNHDVPKNTCNSSCYAQHLLGEDLDTFSAEAGTPLVLQAQNSYCRKQEVRNEPSLAGRLFNLPYNSGAKPELSNDFQKRGQNSPPHNPS